MTHDKKPDHDNDEAIAKPPQRTQVKTNLSAAEIDAIIKRLMERRQMEGPAH